MIVLDTNVLSEVVRAAPSQSVLSWLDEQPLETVFTTSITCAEMYVGAALLPDGAKKERISRVISEIFQVEFAGRVVVFDSLAAEIYGFLVCQRVRAGFPISQSDAMIAAITLSKGWTLATRNVKDFEGLGIDLINPWVC